MAPLSGTHIDRADYVPRTRGPGLEAREIRLYLLCGLPLRMGDVADSEPLFQPPPHLIALPEQSD